MYICIILLLLLGNGYMQQGQPLPDIKQIAVPSFPSITIQRRCRSCIQLHLADTVQDKTLLVTRPARCTATQKGVQNTMQHEESYPFQKLLKLHKNNVFFYMLSKFSPQRVDREESHKLGCKNIEVSKCLDTCQNSKELIQPSKSRI